MTSRINKKYSEEISPEFVANYMNVRAVCLQTVIASKMRLHLEVVCVRFVLCFIICSL